LQRLDSWGELSAHRMATPGAEEGYWRAHRNMLTAKRIRSLRTARGLSQAQLADLAGTSGEVIARLEAGSLSCDVDSLARVAAALDAELVIGFRERDPL
jgi:ribosome-binding protein aMBF1 (putative translation factor)